MARARSRIIPGFLNLEPGLFQGLLLERRHLHLHSKGGDIETAVSECFRVQNEGNSFPEPAGYLLEGPKMIEMPMT